MGQHDLATDAINVTYSFSNFSLIYKFRHYLICALLHTVELYISRNATSVSWLALLGRAALIRRHLSPLRQVCSFYAVLLYSNHYITASWGNVLAAIGRIEIKVLLWQPLNQKCYHTIRLCQGGQQPVSPFQSNLQRRHFTPSRFLTRRRLRQRPYRPARTGSAAMATLSPVAVNNIPLPRLLLCYSGAALYASLLLL